MPARKKSYSRKRPLSYAAFALGKEFDNAQKSAKLAADLGGVNAALGESALANAQQRIAARQMFGGRGMYSGRGGFLQDVESVGHRFLTKGIPNLVKAGGALKGLFGRGLYEGRGGYNANEVMVGGSSNSAEIMSAGDETGGIMICNREYVGDIFGPATSGTFNITAFPLNPGLEQTFPWLSQLAANYEEYEFHQLVFEFKSSLQDVNSNTGQVGTILTATNYNASQPLFTDKPSMAAYYGSVSGKTTDDQTHGVECDPAKLSGSAGQYVRTNPVLIGEDLKMYDHGTFQLATHNIPGTPGSATNPGLLNGTLGELYVYYKVHLRKPKFLTGRGLAITRALFVSGGSESATLPYGTNDALLRGQQNNLNVKVELSANTQKFTFPAYFSGALEIKLYAESTATLSGNLINARAVGGNVKLIADIYAASDVAGDTPLAYTQAVTTVGAVGIIHINVQPATNATDNTLTITSALATTGALTQGMVDICEYNTSFNKIVDGLPAAPILVNTAGVVTVPT